MPGASPAHLTWAGDWCNSKPSKLQPYKTYKLSSVDRSTEIRGMEATRMYEKLIHKTRAIKLGAACTVLAEWPGWRVKEQNFPTSVNRGRAAREWLGCEKGFSGPESMHPNSALGEVCSSSCPLYLDGLKLQPRSMQHSL